MKCTLLSGLLLLALPAVAAAQQAQPAGPQAPVAPAETTLPDNPQSPTDLPVPVGPGGAVEAPAGGSAAAPAEAPIGYSGGDLIISDGSGPSYAEPRAKRIPLHHVVKQGETLWNICEYYYNDPWAWPQLWAYNKTITNPHWIYPGDRIRLLGGSAQSEKEGEGEPVRFRGKPQPDAQRAVRLRQRAVVEDDDLEGAGTVLGSQEAKWMLSRFDEIYVAKGKKFTPEMGKLYSIYRVKEQLKDKEGERIGYLVAVLGTARIKRVTKGKAATAVIVEAYGPIERQDRMGPLRRTFRTMPVRTAEKDLIGEVVANLDDIHMVGVNRLVFIDKGSKHGVKLGNRFLVIRQGDGFQTLAPGEGDDVKDAEEFPEETVAEVSVLEVREKACMGIVTRALREVRNGDRVRLRRGY